MPLKKLVQKAVEDKTKTYSKESSFELYSLEGLGDLESPPPKVSSHVMQTLNVSSRNLKGYKNEHTMSTRLCEGLKVAQDETLHVSLGNITFHKGPRKVKARSTQDTNNNTDDIKKRKVASYSM